MQPDLYFTFKSIMDKGIKDLFNPVVKRMDKKPKDDSLFAWRPQDTNDLVNKDKSDSDDISSILRRCHRIHHRYL